MLQVRLRKTKTGEMKRNPQINEQPGEDTPGSVPPVPHGAGESRSTELRAVKLKMGLCHTAKPE